LSFASAEHSYTSIPSYVGIKKFCNQHQVKGDTEEMEDARDGNLLIQNNLPSQKNTVIGDQGIKACSYQQKFCSNVSEEEELHDAVSEAAVAGPLDYLPKTNFNTTCNVALPFGQNDDESLTNRGFPAFKRYCVATQCSETLPAK